MTGNSFRKKKMREKKRKKKEKKIYKLLELSVCLVGK